MWLVLFAYRCDPECGGKTTTAAWAVIALIVERVGSSKPSFSCPRVRRQDSEPQIAHNEQVSTLHGN